MARKQSPTLTDAELRLMKILWERGSSTVGSVVETLPDDEPLAYSTVLTTLRILEEKGYLRHEKQGRAYVYHTVVDRRAARRNALRYLMDRFFNNSPELLVLGILENEDMDLADLERLKNIIEESD